MQTPQQRLDHAEHNLKLANKLLEEGEFLDWVVTSSFYAAIHYCRYKLFPLEDKNTPGTSLCDNFDQFTYENRSKLALHQQRQFQTIVKGKNLVSRKMI